MKLVNEMKPTALKTGAVWLSVVICYGLIPRCKNRIKLVTTPLTDLKQINVEPYPTHNGTIESRVFHLHVSHFSGTETLKE
ncbi:hypothetical protein [Glaciimonas soli]|uniref:Uncharacterized protein n=1 Tax=Glaciimonas soli TaxID=2590999 RepID=A0A843YVC8_9BURK|nr:hypothetical protein [Glaciimonas soli]MQR01947.1 hypothetical protein [Glaciimonas soli]